MNKTIKTFVFVHDQDIILDFIDKQRFSIFENMTWVFLGYRDTDKIEHLNNLIICRNYDDNLEIHKNLTSFTGWYCLYKNNLIDCDYVNFFEYDINYCNDFSDINREIIKKDVEFVGYIPIKISNPNYIKFTKFSDKLIESIMKKTGDDILSLIKTKNQDSVWSSTSNSTWKTSVLFDYIEWFIQFIDDITVSQYCGHMHERSISFYYFLKNLKILVTKNLIEHFQLNSHDTSGFSHDRHKLFYDKLK